MAISKEAYKVLESIVGPEYISADPAICEGYRAGPGGYECGLEQGAGLCYHATNHGRSSENYQGL